ncbi:hypothetical protein [Rhizobium sp. RAF56]|uniref:hypothetical protein n=1 Tax=Rhizobium sp. RAF56 TaxID=3233062 RepID=UPI003F9B2DBF
MTKLEQLCAQLNEECRRAKRKDAPFLEAELIYMLAEIIHRSVDWVADEIYVSWVADHLCEVLQYIRSRGGKTVLTVDLR